MSKHAWWPLPGIGLALLLSAPALAREKIQATEIGARVEGQGELRDLRGNRRPLRDFTEEARAVVLAFLGTECPVASVYVPTLVELDKRYRSQGVQFVALYPNTGDDLDVIAAHSYDRDVPFPVLKDVNQKLADLVGVERVPTVVVLDQQLTLRYRGRIDDRHGVAARKPRATRHDLEEAIKEVLAGKKVSQSETEADGCVLQRAQTSEPRPEITYSKQVARILQKGCQSCHRPGQAAPFSLLSYEDAVRHARMIREVTRQRRMPPWHADARYGTFINDRRLSSEDIATLAAWVDSGMPRGDARELPAPVEWPEGWTLGKHDLEIEMPEEFEVPADGVLPYKYFTVETNFEEDRWVRMAEARPGAADVVHHVVVYILQGNQRRPFSQDGNMSVLVGWAPGDLGMVCPPDTALRLPKGARLLFELHYTPNGKKVKDRSKIGLTFARKPPRFELLMNAFPNPAIKLPPHEPHYRAEATFRFRADARLISFVPHMHWRGKHFFYEAIYPDGQRQTLLSVPRWDFTWQTVYQLKEPLKMPAGTRIHAVAHWDNSRHNPLNPDPSKAVGFGLQTWEEMMVGWIAYVWERPEAAAELKRTPPSQADLAFERMDSNGDDLITRDEIPERIQTFLLLAGVSIPEKMDRKDFVSFFEEMRKRFERRRAAEKKD